MFRTNIKSLILCLAWLPLGGLLVQTDENGILYDDSHLADVEIEIDPATLGWIYDNSESDSEHFAVFRFRNDHIDEIVDSVGFRLRGNTSRQSAKKSFRISFNTFVKGRKFHGVEELNLNGEHNDPSIIRSKLCFDLFEDIGMIASRANHVRVFINGRYYGLYVSVEHMDKEFLRKNFSDDAGNLWKCLYPADLTYLGDNPSLYRDLNSGSRPAYDLTTNEDNADFQPLARLVRVLNRTPSARLPDSCEAVLDVPGVLKYFAMNILLGSWDDYWSLMNNYYLYHDPSADRFSIIPYDYDNTFGIDWFNIDWSTANPYDFPKVASGNRPLAERLLANNQYRDLYTHFLDFFSRRVFSLPLWENRIDRIRRMIADAALADSFRTLDWGFTAADFMNSYSASDYQNQHVKFGLKQFVNRRNANLPGWLTFRHGQPIVYRIDVESFHPSSDDSITVEASCFGSAGLREVSIQATLEGSTSAQVVPMTFQPVPDTKKVEEADRWRGVLAPLGAGQSMSIRISVKDSLNQVQQFPRTGSLEIETPGSATGALVLNEFMADNDSVFADPAGEYDDWIELYNRGSSPVLLTGMTLTDRSDNLTKWRFLQSDLLVDSGAYLIIWCDEQQSQEGVHVNFKLSAGGEFIALVDTDGVSVVDSLSFGPQTTDVSFGRIPNGFGAWQSTPPTPGAQNAPDTGVREERTSELTMTLSVFPNPFNPMTTVRFVCPAPGPVSVKVFDMLGREAAVLVEEKLEAGTHQRIFDANRLPNGVYVCRFQAGRHEESVKILLLK